MQSEIAQMANPFKFLAPYEIKDTDIFFGRETEEGKLYELLTASNLVLVYGPSGTGKTSLIQCGLSKKYSMPDWIPLFIKRNGNFNQSILSVLQNILPDKQGEDIMSYIRAIYNKYYRPVYLFLDQFEEVFTLAERDANGRVILKDEKIEELALLLKSIRILSESEFCKIVFIIREEFLGALYHYEEDLPNLFDFRLRIEPLKPSMVNEVVSKSFDEFKVSYTPQIIDKIQSNLFDGNFTSQLAYLQVYLSRLWEDAYKEEYEQKIPDEIPPPVILTIDTVNKLGKIETILEEYLSNTIQEISTHFSVSQKEIESILDRFVTEDGTKRPIRKDTIPQKSILDALEQARLIRQDDTYYELAHDTLAAIVENKHTGEQKLINNLVHSFRTNYHLFDEVGKGYLNEQNIALYDKYKEEIERHLKEDKKVIDYIKASRTHNEHDRITKEQQRLTLSKSNKWLKIAIMGVIILSLVVTVVAWKAFSLNDEAQENLQKYHQQKAKELIQEAQTYENSNDIESALEKAIQADSLDPNNIETNNLLKKYKAIKR